MNEEIKQALVALWVANLSNFCIFFGAFDKLLMEEQKEVLDAIRESRPYLGEEDSLELQIYCELAHDLE